MNSQSILIRGSLALLGAILFIAGLLTFWLPIPIGIPLMLVGMPLLFRNSPLARFGFIKLARRYRPMRSVVNRFRKNKP